jgi:hypothetical protein
LIRRKTIQSTVLNKRQKNKKRLISDPQTSTPFSLGATPSST